MSDNFAHHAAEWDNPSKVQMTNKFVNALIQNIELKKHWRALEIGAGRGLVGLQLFPFVGSVVFENTAAAMLGVL
jgi:protein-L-isoaspartate O-methyltransferase